MLVYVQNKYGEPLMPCKACKARKLLEEKKAKIEKYEPFTIGLLYGSSGYKQPITLGIDAGSKTIGVSASTDQQELYSAEIELRSDIVENISTRRAYRRGRRHRKTRYRKPKFQNRKRKAGWLAPSIKSKIDSHVNRVAEVHKVLPVSKTIVEVASFDIQKIKNAEISGVAYQQGEQLGFWNVREYVLFRDGHQCQGQKGCKNKILNVHHIESRKTGGDAPNNLITLCETCHTAYHSGKLKLNVKRRESFRDAAFMGMMRWAFYNKLKSMYPNVSVTYGYITKNTRIRNGVEKTHGTDAYCIAGNMKARRCEGMIVRQMRKKKRSLHEAIGRKGRMASNSTQKRNNKNTSKIMVGDKTWCLLDKVRIMGMVGFITGFTGHMAYVQSIKGKYIQTTSKYKQVSTKEMELICRNNNWVSSAIHPTA